MAVGQSVPNSTVPLRSSLPDLGCALDLGKKLEAPGQVLLILSHSPVLLFLLKEKAAFSPLRGDTYPTLGNVAHSEHTKWALKR